MCRHCLCFEEGRRMQKRVVVVLFCLATACGAAPHAEADDSGSGAPWAGPAASFDVYQKSGLADMTHHHRLGNRTMFGNSTLGTQAATAEETPEHLYLPTSTLSGPWVPSIPFSGAQNFQRFSQKMTTPPRLEPMVLSSPSLGHQVSPGMSLHGLWPASGSIAVPTEDLDRFGDIKWDHGTQNSPFSLDHIMD